MSQFIPDVAHAEFGPSSAKRYINCPASVRACREHAEDQELQTWTQEGQLGHSLAELYLRAWLDNGGYPTDYELDTLRAHPLYSKDLEDAANEYVTTVQERFAAALRIDPSAQIRIEKRVDISEFTCPGQFGTMDCGLVYADTLEVIDLKMGKGVWVDARENEQTRCYALGFMRYMDPLFMAKRFVLTIVQPRIDSRGYEEISRDELIEWGLTVLKPAVERALSAQANFKAGSWCQFCKIRSTCRARAADSMQALEAVLAAPVDTPPVLSLPELGELLPRLAQVKQWVRHIEAYALRQHCAGNTIPGMKLVAGKGYRQYTNELDVAKALETGGINPAAIWERHLLGVTAMENLIGRGVFKSLTAGLVARVPGPPTLVPEEDRRPEILAPSSAAALFAANPMKQDAHEQATGSEADPGDYDPVQDLLRVPAEPEKELGQAAGEVQLHGDDQKDRQGVADSDRGSDQGGKGRVRRQVRKSTKQPAHSAT